MEPMEGEIRDEEQFGEMEQTGEDFGPMDGMEEGQADGGFDEAQERQQEEIDQYDD
jgi:hypothetical protein